jgi:hypothetical protein
MSITPEAMIDEQTERFGFARVLLSVLRAGGTQLHPRGLRSQ